MQLYHIFYNECKPVNMDLLQEFSYVKPTENLKTPMQKEVHIPVNTSIETPDLLQKIEQHCMKANGVQDGLFWSIYIAVYGYPEYLRNKYNYGKLEIKEKQKIAEYISSLCRSGANKMKTNYKVARSFCGEIVADLTSLPRMVLSGLIGMCVFYKSDIYIVDIVKNTYLYFLYQGEDKKVEDTIVLYKNPLHTKKFHSNEYFVDIGFTIQTLEEIHENYVGIEHYQKPLKGISTYLKPDLEKIAEKTVFNISSFKMPIDSEENGASLIRKGVKDKNTDTLSKQELYNTILIFLSNSV